jgi:predicted Holliday junction resolvase-like endonuclease
VVVLEAFAFGLVVSLSILCMVIVCLFTVLLILVVHLRQLKVEVGRMAQKFQPAGQLAELVQLSRSVG